MPSSAAKFRTHCRKKRATRPCSIGRAAQSRLLKRLALERVRCCAGTQESDCYALPSDDRRGAIVSFQTGLLIARWPGRNDKKLFLGGQPVSDAGNLSRHRIAVGRFGLGL